MTPRGLGPAQEWNNYRHPRTKGTKMIKKVIAALFVTVGVVAFTGPMAGAHTSSLRHCINETVDGGGGKHCTTNYLKYREFRDLNDFSR